MRSWLAPLAIKTICRNATTYSHEPKSVQTYKLKLNRDASIPQVWWPDGGYKRLFLRHSHVNVKITIFKILQRACWGTEPYVALH